MSYARAAVLRIEARACFAVTSLSGQSSSQDSHVGILVLLTTTKTPCLAQLPSIANCRTDPWVVRLTTLDVGLVEEPPPGTRRTGFAACDCVPGL